MNESKYTAISVDTELEKMQQKAPSLSQTAIPNHNSLKADSPSGALWREWFRRLGDKATAEVVNATATLVINERELATQATVSPASGAEPSIVREVAELGCLRGCQVHCAEREADSANWCVACKASYLLRGSEYGLGQNTEQQIAGRDVPL
jgi:hypothetical protein